MALWFKTSVRFDKIQENGTVKKVTKSYLVNALSFTEAEARIIEEVTPFISGEYSVEAVKKANIAELFEDEGGSDKWYKVKVNFITLDERTATEKRKATNILVQATDLQDALQNFLKGMKGTVSDYEIASISETPILEVFKLKTNN